MNYKKIFGNIRTNFEWNTYFKMIESFECEIEKGMFEK